MTSEQALVVLLWASLVASCLLFLIATAMVGRKITDLDYQRQQGRNGTLRIQSIINLRTHALRVLLAITFGLFAILLIADAPMIWRQWVNRILFVVVPGGYFIACLMDWLAEHEQVRIEVNHEKERSALEAQAVNDAWKSHQQMTEEAIEALDIAVDRTLAAQGRMRPARIAAVVAEHSSPITEAQRATAKTQTLRAKLTAARLALDLPPREPSPPVDVESIQPGAIDDIVEAVRKAEPDA